MAVREKVFLIGAVRVIHDEKQTYFAETIPA